jgi:hypothetical protein
MLEVAADGWFREGRGLRDGVGDVLSLLLPDGGVVEGNLELGTLLVCSWVGVLWDSEPKDRRPGVVADSARVMRGPGESEAGLPIMATGERDTVLSDLGSETDVLFCD